MEPPGFKDTTAIHIRLQNIGMKMGIRDFFKPRVDRKAEATGAVPAFEDRVAKWARKQFGSVGVKRNQSFKGRKAVRTLDVDIVLRTRPGLITQGEVIWMKCEDRRASIGRDDICKLLEAAQDVKGETGPAYPDMPIPITKSDKEWDYLVFVSTAEFGAGAIDFARQHKVGCYYYDGRAFQEVVELIRS